MACYLVAADCSIFIVKTFVGQPNSISLKVLALNVTFRADCWVWLVQSFPADASRYTSPFWSFTILSFSAQAPPRHAPLVALCPRSGSSPRRHFVPDCHYLCAIATISGCRATIMSRQVSQRLSLMIPPSPNVANDYLHGPRRMCIWEVACSSSLCASFLYTFRLEWTFSPSHLFSREFQGLYQNAFEILGIDERLTSTYVHEWLNQLPMSTSCSTTLSFALESPSWLSQLLFRSVTMPVKRLLSVHATQSSLLF
jgi:hypothetical protein